MIINLEIVWIFNFFHIRLVEVLGFFNRLKPFLTFLTLFFWPAPAAGILLKHCFACCLPLVTVI